MHQSSILTYRITRQALPTEDKTVEDPFSCTSGANPSILQGRIRDPRMKVSSQDGRDGHLCNGISRGLLDEESIHAWSRQVRKTVSLWLTCGKLPTDLAVALPDFDRLIDWAGCGDYWSIKPAFGLESGSNCHSWLPATSGRQRLGSTAMRQWGLFAMLGNRIGCQSHPFCA